MRTIETTVYTFPELSDAAKENARTWYRKASEGDTWWSESVIEDAIRIGAMMGLEINQKCVYWSGFWSQGDGASFSGSYCYRKGAVDLVARETGNDASIVSIAKRLQEIQRKCFYGLSAVITTNGHHCHEYTMRASAFDRNGYEMDADTSDEMLDCFRDFARWIYKNLESAYEWENSDECIDEIMTINDYEFFENGKKHDYTWF